MAGRIYSVDVQPIVQITGDDGPMYFTVSAVEELPALGIGCEPEWVAYLQPVRIVPEVELVREP